MIVVDNESLLVCDVDQTLVMWTGLTPTSMAIHDPYDGLTNHVTPHHGHIKILKDHKTRGSRVIVWSAAGFAWAESVVKALGLEKYVDFVMTKPYAYLDDLRGDEILGEHIYLPFETNYGRRE